MFRLLLALLLLVLPATAGAHAVLRSSAPADGAALPEAPTAIDLLWNEPVHIVSVQLIGADGNAIPFEGVGAVGDRVAWTLPAALPDGGWLVSWRVISTDSHPISGSVRFKVGDPTVAFPQAEAAVGQSTLLPRALLVLGVLGCGGLLLAGPLLGRSSSAGRLALVAAAIGSVWYIVATAEALGGGVPAIGVAANALGVPLIGVLAALLAGAFLAEAGRLRLAALFGLAALVGLGFAGHIAGAPPVAVSRPIHLVHAAAAAAWLGSLILLLRRRDAAAPLARFSRLAPWLVGCLALAGGVLILLQAGSVTLLVESDWGLSLAIKLALVALLLALAAVNRWRLTRPALAGRDRWLRRSIMAELALFVAIVAVTATIGTNVPPRSVAAARSFGCPVEGPVELVGRDIDLEVVLTLASACAGPNDFSVAMRQVDGTAVTPVEVALRFSLPDHDIEMFEGFADSADGATFALRAWDLPLPGEWRIEVRVLLDAYALRRVRFRVPLAPV